MPTPAADAPDVNSQPHPAHSRVKNQARALYPFSTTLYPIRLKKYRPRRPNFPRRLDDQTEFYALPPRHEFFSLDAGGLKTASVYSVWQAELREGGAVGLTGVEPWCTEPRVAAVI